MGNSSEPKTHAGFAGGTLCGSNSWAAIARAQTCSRCDARLDQILLVLLDAAEGQDVRERAAKLVRVLGLTRSDDEKAR